MAPLFFSFWKLFILYKNTWKRHSGFFLNLHKVQEGEKDWVVNCAQAALGAFYRFFGRRTRRRQGVGPELPLDVSPLGRRIRPSFTRCRKLCFRIHICTDCGMLCNRLGRDVSRVWSGRERKPNGWHALAQHPAGLMRTRNGGYDDDRMRLFYSALLLLFPTRLSDCF